MELLSDLSSVIFMCKTCQGLYSNFGDLECHVAAQCSGRLEAESVAVSREDYMTYILPRKDTTASMETHCMSDGDKDKTGMENQGQAELSTEKPNQTDLCPPEQLAQTQSSQNVVRKPMKGRHCKNTITQDKPVSDVKSLQTVELEHEKREQPEHDKRQSTRNVAKVDYKRLSDSKVKDRIKVPIITRQLSTDTNREMTNSALLKRSQDDENSSSKKLKVDSEETVGKKYSQYEKWQENTLTYHCPHCPKKTHHIGFFKRHMETCHNDGKGFLCDHCDEKIMSATEYKLHLNKHNRPFKCDTCASQFPQKKDLISHAKIHTGEYSYFCQHCDYKARHPRCLKEHMRIHEGTPLKCELEGCNYTTIYAYAMKVHMLNKHQEKGVHKCSFCQYVTNDRSAFTKHMKIHLGIKNFQCGVCQYQARTKHDVVRHMVVHSSDKVYHCHKCDFSTAHTSALKSHLMCHIGVKPWHCGACDFKAMQRSRVVKHIHSKHPGEKTQDLVVNSGVKVFIKPDDFKAEYYEAVEPANEDVTCIILDEDGASFPIPTSTETAQDAVYIIQEPGQCTSALGSTHNINNEQTLYVDHSDNTYEVVVESVCNDQSLPETKSSLLSTSCLVESQVL